MKIYTGNKKTPNGYYVVVIEYNSDKRDHILNILSTFKDIKIDIVGDKIFVFTRSRKVQKLLMKKISSG